MPGGWAAAGDVAASETIYTFVLAPDGARRAIAFHQRIPMGKLTTHVLDTAHGCPAAGLRLELFRMDEGQAVLLRQVSTNADGRMDGPLLEGDELVAAAYRLVFEAGDYFAARGLALPEPRFVDRIALDFGIAEPGQHYHVPLLVSPWSWSTYRGS